MARAARPSRLAKVGQAHLAKRYCERRDNVDDHRMKGNNRFGSKGCVKCDECRRRKTRVDLIRFGLTNLSSVNSTRKIQMNRVATVKGEEQIVGKPFRRKSAE